MPQPTLNFIKLLLGTCFSMGLLALGKQWLQEN
jgi:hypothetical protein